MGILGLLFKIIPLVFVGLTLFLIIKSSGNIIIKAIFWLTFLNIFITHAFFRDFIIDTIGLGLSTRVNWFAELILYVLVVRIFLASKYKNMFIGLNLFTFSVIILIISTLFNFKSIPLSILSLRVMYVPLLLVYVVYIYQMDIKSYEWFFKLFIILAVINSALSIIQFVYREQLGWSTQFTSGIFGFHGTGVGAIFSVVQSTLCFQIFLNNKNKIYLFLAFFTSIPIMTGYAFGGFAFLFIAIVVVLLKSLRKLHFKKLSIVILTGLLLIYGLVEITKYSQDVSGYQSYFSLFAKPELYLSIFTNSDIVQTHPSLSRISNLYFAINEITTDVIYFFVGYGPGAISYNAYTLGYHNPLVEIYRGTGLPLMTYIYELGIWGPFLLFISFFFLYKKLKVTQRPSKGISQYYYDNFIVLLIVYLLGTLYTAVLNNFILVMFFAVQASYINKLYLTQKCLKSNNNYDRILLANFLNFLIKWTSGQVRVELIN